MENDLRQRARQHLDDRLSHLRPEDAEPPPRGWIRALRDALGMSGVQLARRLGVSAQTVDATEKSEARGTIRIETLRRAAEALDCTLVYALVPKTSLEGTVRGRARTIALRELERVAHTMKLEAQATGDSASETRIEEYIRDVLTERDLWNERD